jgi:hypothetical protein
MRLGMWQIVAVRDVRHREQAQSLWRSARDCCGAISYSRRLSQALNMPDVGTVFVRMMSINASISHRLQDKIAC